MHHNNQSAWNFLEFMIRWGIHHLLLLNEVPLKPDLLFSSKSVCRDGGDVFKCLKLSFSGVPFKGVFPMLLFYPWYLMCADFTHLKNSLKWNPWRCLWNAFFPETDCRGNYSEPTSFCLRVEWCKFPSIFLTLTTKDCKFAWHFYIQAICQWTVDLQDLLSYYQPSRSTTRFSRMCLQHTETTGMALGSLASRKVIYSVLKLPLQYPLIKIFGIPKLIW